MAQNPGRRHDAEPRAHRDLHVLVAERVVARRGRRLRGVEVERRLLVGWVTRSGTRPRRRRQPEVDHDLCDTPAVGSLTVARIFKRPRHLGHWSESAPMVRRRRRCQSMRRDSAKSSPSSKRPQCATVMLVGITTSAVGESSDVAEPGSAD
ncbi:hypothetical protein [Sorangium sp. So ce1078]|uniref:hypothetical protein n=1 Tax=Sorangium sp. So ce1078 TaxID=3133329 RepID=UPI003F63D8FF